MERNREDLSRRPFKRSLEAGDVSHHVFARYGATRRVQGAAEARPERLFHHSLRLRDRDRRLRALSGGVRRSAGEWLGGRECSCRLLDLSQPLFDGARLGKLAGAGVSRSRRFRETGINGRESSREAESQSWMACRKRKQAEDSSRKTNDHRRRV